MANQKLTQDELDKLQELQQKNAALVNELGGISLAEINISERKEGATKFLAELRESEKELVDALEEAYGIGSIDLKNGEFIPAPKEEKGVEEAEVVEEK
jgi:hypothetical protein